MKKECGKIKNERELEFAIFCIENVAQRLGEGGEKVFSTSQWQAIFCMIISFHATKLCIHRIRSTSLTIFWEL